MPASEMHDDRLTQEAEITLAAGTVTTGMTMALISYHVIVNERIRSTLQNELGELMQECLEKTPSLVELEKLPYLSGVIKEGLR